MPNDLNWAGNCRGQIIDYALWAAESGAIAVNITARIDECWQPSDQGDAWFNYCEHDYVADGAIWIVKKDGNLNQRQVEALMKHCNWDGDLASIDEHRWEPTPCSFTTTEETYKDKARCRISWLNAYDAIPGVGGNVSPEKVQELCNRYGSSFRALAGNLARNAIPPVTKAPLPKGPIGARRPPKDAPPYPDPNLDPPTVEASEIPFDGGPPESPVDPQIQLGAPTSGSQEAFWRAQLANKGESLAAIEQAVDGDPCLNMDARKRLWTLIEHRKGQG